MGWETNVCRVTSANSLIGLTAGTVKHLSLSTYYALASEGYTTVPELCI